MKHIKNFNESHLNREVVFKSKRNPNQVIIITKRPDGRIESIDNKANIRFPYKEGQMFTRNLEVWACNNNFLMDDKDTCPEKKIFGVKVSDVPKGHKWRTIYPNKFR